MIFLNNLRLQAMIFSAAILLFAAGCGGGNEKPEGKAESEAKEEFTVVKGISVGELDKDLAAKGKTLFDTKCVACHKLDTRLVGPPLGDVAKRRSAEYIVSMIMSPDKMIANNDTTKALLAKYMTSMTNQNVNQDDARAIYEYFREVSSNK